ncbi:MAG: argininosuccinate lyase, partial [Clostridia bacterium]|nr:argininosuccinate lyase [Clostridia bacterium]
GFDADKLGFASVCLSSIDGVSDRDFAVELIADVSTLMMHLSRFSEEIVLWTSSEFGYVVLSDEFTTGSSIMPQKKNSDMAELVRGKTGRVYGDLIALLTTLKGLPLAYNKDMQEDKESVFDACDTAEMCLDVFVGMIRTMSVNTENMKKAAGGGFINATDLADYLVGRGLPFRSAYKISGQIVSYCIAQGEVLETLPLDDYKKFSDLFDEGVYAAVDLDACVARRVSEGGTSVGSVERQIEYIRKTL